MLKIILTENPLRFNLEPFLKYFQMSFAYESPYAVCNGRVCVAKLNQALLTLPPLMRCFANSKRPLLIIAWLFSFTPRSWQKFSTGKNVETVLMQLHLCSEQ